MDYFEISLNTHAFANAQITYTAEASWSWESDVKELVTLPGPDTAWSVPISGPIALNFTVPLTAQIYAEARARAELTGQDL